MAYFFRAINIGCLCPRDIGSDSNPQVDRNAASDRDTTFDSHCYSLSNTLTNA